MRANLEMLLRVFVDEGRTRYGEAFEPRRQRDRSHHTRPCALRRLDNPQRRLVEHAVVICFKADTNFVLKHLSTFPWVNNAGWHKLPGIVCSLAIERDLLLVAQDFGDRTSADRQT